MYTVIRHKAMLGLVEDTALNWHDLFCFSLECYCQVAVRLPVVLKNISDGAVSTSESYALTESIRFAKQNAAILSAFIQYNPTFRHTKSLLKLITVYTAIPLIFASKMNIDGQDPVIENSIIVHYNTLNLHIKFQCLT
jgi:hypothetical protein